MYLKEIKAVGFKSFADKTTIEMTPGITGIVGPNGSGKSNIVDAVRWVIGEQSVKSLRGEASMSDIIFSGSKSRGAQSAASVTLIFDNTNHYLPLDYEEVSIKRTVYKSGENEYFINNEKCRLKDIQILLVDSGISRESFNIISQGEISKILSNKPEERRIIFEEAAGVLKYKKRKEEALRKLDRMHNNMTRVNDIINELEMQVTPLKSQSEAAVKYLEAKHELEDIEISLIANDVELLKYDYDKKQSEIEILNLELINFETENSNIDSELVKIKNDKEKIDQELMKTNENILKISTELERLMGEKNIVLEKTKHSKDEKKLELEALTIKEQELKTNIEIKRIESEIKNKEKELEENNIKAKEEENNFNVLQNKRRDYNTKIQNLILESSKLKNQINLLQDSIENNSRLPYAVKNVIRNPKLKGIHAVVGDILDIDERYSTGIEVALGSSITQVIVDNELMAKKAIEYLRENRLGRATFLPLNVIKSRYLDTDTLNKIKKEDSFIGIASSLVKYQDIYKNIVENLLGNVIVTKDINKANEIGRLINYKAKIVSLDGDLISPGGSITGGSIKKTGSMISEKYELDKFIRDQKQIEDEIEKISDLLKNEDKKIEEEKEKLYQLQIKSVELQEIINVNKKQLDSVNKEYNALQNELKNINNIVNNTVDKEVLKIMDLVYKSENEKNILVNEAKALNKKKQDINERIEELEIIIKKQNTSVTKKQEELKQLEISVNRIDVKIDNYLNILTEEYGITFDKAKENYKLEIDQLEARKKVTSLRNEIKSLGDVNVNAIEEYEKVSTRYNFLTKQKEDLTKAEITIVDIIKELDGIMKVRFKEAFESIRTNFKEVFKELFKGGNAELKFTDEDNILETGIDIEASPPGKKLQHLSLLSGGEKTLTAISLLFAILKARPVPFCLLDEVEAALDDVNVDYFGKYLSTFKDKTQFILITHKKKTMEYADNLYGITMQESGVSKFVSVKLEEIKDYSNQKK